MDFSSKTVVVREICNGAMFISALFVIGVFTNYVVHRCRTDLRCFEDPVVQAALFIVVLIIGHAVRAGSSWMEFVWRDLGWDAGFWTELELLFLSATVLIVVGKMLIVYMFANYRLRWMLTFGALAAAVLIPCGLALVIAMVK